MGIMTKEDILKIVEKKEEEKEFMKRCLAIDTCPNCGCDLSSEYFDDGGTEYKCGACGNKYSD